MAKLIPFIAHAIDNKILANPIAVNIGCNAEIIGVVTIKDFDANYAIVSMQAFTIVWADKTLSNKDFDRNSFLEYLASNCNNCSNCE